MSDNVGEFLSGEDAGRLSGGGRGGGGAYGNVGGSARQIAVWGAVASPKPQHEDRMDRETADTCWNGIFGLFGSTGEEMRKEVKLAVYAYFGVNGSSRFGEYEREIRTGSGRAVSARDVVKVIGVTRLRQFLRADPSEAYFSLKGSGALDADPVSVAKAVELGVPVGQAYLMADFLKACPEFSASEREVYSRLFERGIMRAGANRGGKSVEQEARDTGMRGVEAQRAAMTQHNGDVF